jgi:hypothetical protein
MEFINPKEIIDHDAQLLESTYSMAMVCFVYYKKQRAVRGGGRKKVHCCTQCVAGVQMHDCILHPSLFSS